MKKILAVITIAFGLNCTSHAAAESNGLNGMLLGAGGGALVGQAIGRDTKGTLIGTAVGSVLGYAIGNGMDRSGGGYRTTQVYQPPIYESSRVVVLRPESQETCRETEMLATIDGRPEKVYGTACWQDGEWVRLADERPRPVISETVILYEDRWRGDHHRRHGHYRPDFRRGGGHGRHDHQSRVIYRAGW